MTSPALLWECVKDRSCFLVKSKNMPVMTKEPANICGLNSLRYSGLANRQILNVTSVTSGKKEKIMLVQRQKKVKKIFRPSSSFVKTGLHKNKKRGLAGIDKALDSGFYRRDLLDLAKTKYLKIKKSFTKNKVSTKSLPSKKDT